MDLIPYLSAGVLVSTIATIVLAVLSYVAFKLRNKRKPKASTVRPVYFHRVRFDVAPPDTEESS